MGWCLRSFVIENSGDRDYRNSDQPLSPWVLVQGWHLQTCFHDPMHVVYLGTLRDLYASMLSYWLRKTNYGGAGSYAHRLRIISHDLKSMCRARQFLIDIWCSSFGTATLSFPLYKTVWVGNCDP